MSKLKLKYDHNRPRKKNRDTKKVGHQALIYEDPTISSSWTNRFV